jgi:hypothetical protein
MDSPPASLKAQKSQSAGGFSGKRRFVQNRYHSRKYKFHGVATFGDDNLLKMILTVLYSNIDSLH